MGTPIDIRMLSGISLFASKEETRYYLNGVCLEIEPRSVTYVATDGHRLVANCRFLLDEDEDNDVLGTFIVPTAQCRAFKPSKHTMLPATLTGDSARLTLSYEGVDHTFAPIDGTFPSWRKVVPASKMSGAPGHFNFAYLGDFVKFCKIVEGGTPHIISDGPQNPALIDFSTRPDVIGVLMPVRGPDLSARMAPDWTRAPAQQEAA